MAQIYGERFADPDGRIRATFDVIWLSGWAPHESQQKPLQPGSAKASLAEAVKGKTKGGDRPDGAVSLNVIAGLDPCNRVVLRRIFEDDGCAGQARA